MATMKNVILYVSLFVLLSLQVAICDQSNDDEQQVGLLNRREVTEADAQNLGLMSRVRRSYHCGCHCVARRLAAQTADYGVYCDRIVSRPFQFQLANRERHTQGRLRVVNDNINHFWVVFKKGNCFMFGLPTEDPNMLRFAAAKRGGLRLTAPMLPGNMECNNEDGRFITSKTNDNNDTILRLGLDGKFLHIRFSRRLRYVRFRSKEEQATFWSLSNNYWG